MKSLALLLLPLLSASAQAATCPVTEKQLLGAWTMAGQASRFEEFALTIEDGRNTFNAWMHHRPDMLGARWTFEHCELTVLPAADDGLPPSRFLVLGLHKDRLRLRDLSDQSEMVYRRVGK